jgi:hypothetical protein
VKRDERSDWLVFLYFLGGEANGVLRKRSCSGPGHGLVFSIEIERERERMEPMRHRPQGVVAKLLAQQPLEVGVGRMVVGNQKAQDEAPEQSDDSEESGEDARAGTKWDDESSPSSASSAGSPMATPPSSPESARRPEAAEEWEMASSDEPANRDSVSSETYGSLADEPLVNRESDGQQQQHEQLQSDVEVLAAHLQQQTLALAHERSVNQALQTQLTAMQQALAHEIDDLRIENGALRHENARLEAVHAASQQQLQESSETQDELLRTLRAQQQRDDHARTIIAALVKERDVLKKQLDDSKTYCRRLEEDVVGLRAETQQLRVETQSLQTAVEAASSHRNDRELQLIREQEQTIQSLRADVLQMEFEYRTVSVDKDTLRHRVATLERQSESRSTSYDVISLQTDADKKTHRKTKRFSVAKTSKHDAASGGGGSFTNLMTLPNSVDDGSSSSNSMANTGGIPAGPRAKTPMGLVSKTLSSAKKRLFQPSSSSAHHTTTVVLPQ